MSYSSSSASSTFNAAGESLVIRPSEQQPLLIPSVPTTAQQQQQRQSQLLPLQERVVRSGLYTMNVAISFLLMLVVMVCPDVCFLFWSLFASR